MLLLELDRNELLWEIMNILEDLTKQANIVNLQRKIVSLKIKYYRAHGEGAGFLQAAGLHYQLTEMVEQENQNMIKSMMDVRNSLEQANEQRRIVEEANLRLQQKSETDQLTGLANRYRLNAYSENVLTVASKTARRWRWKFWTSIISSSITIIMGISQEIFAFLRLPKN